MTEVLSVFSRLRRLLADLFNTEPWLAEFGSGLAILIWGLLAVFGTPTPTDWPSMSLMLAISDSDMWGWFGVALGLGQLAFFRFFDRRWKRPWLRWGAAIIIGWMWAVITISTCRITPWVPGLGAFIGMYAVNVILIFRIFVRSRV